MPTRIWPVSCFFHPRTGLASVRDKPANHKRGKNPVCIVFDYSRTLSQKEFPVGLRSLLNTGNTATIQRMMCQGLNTFIR